jgi:hypothetical protein
VSWLNEVMMEFYLLPQVFHLAVGMIDRYLARRSGLPINRLQLLGVGAMLAAARYETPDWFEYGCLELARRVAGYADLDDPTRCDGINCFAVVTSTYSRGEVVAMAADIEALGVPSAEFAASTALVLLASMHSRQAKVDVGFGCISPPGHPGPAGEAAGRPPGGDEAAARRLKLLAEYLVEISLQRACFLEYDHAEVAAAALLLARQVHRIA